MAANDVWVVTLFTDVLSGIAENVFTYRGNAITTPSNDDIADAFEEQLIPLIRPLMLTDFTIVGLKCYNLFTAEAESNRLLDLAGTFGSGDSSVPFAALSFKLGGAENTTRPGSKRFCPPPETVVSLGTINDSGYISDMNDLADAMEIDLLDAALGILNWAAPVIVKRILDGDTWRFPTSVGELVTNLIVEVVPKIIVGSQNSRKIGVGS